ncbi:hypothetical protein I6A81_39390, partial [Frankia sp. CN7]
MKVVAVRALAQRAGGVAEDGGPGLLGLRLLLLVGILLLLVAVVGFLRQMWRRRATRQEDDLPELLAPPEDRGTVLSAPLRGSYLGTTDAGYWLEWFSARGLGGKDGSYITVHVAGIQVDRGKMSFWIPREAVRGARLERAHAGKVAAPGRLLVIAWSLEGRELETGFRGDDRARQPKVAHAVHELIGPPAAPTDGEITSPRPTVRALRQLRPRRHQPAGAEGAGGHAARRGQGQGTHQAPHRGSRLHRRGGSRTPQQDIADRRGADPYGTGPRRAGGHSVDPYVTSPRGVPRGTGPAAPGGAAGPTPAPPAAQAPPARPAAAAPPARPPGTGVGPGPGSYGQAAPDTTPYGQAARPTGPPPASPAGPGEPNWQVRDPRAPRPAAPPTRPAPAGRRGAHADDGFTVSGPGRGAPPGGASPGGAARGGVPP